MSATYKQGCEYLNGVVVYWPSPLHAFDWDNMVSMSVLAVPPPVAELQYPLVPQSFWRWIAGLAHEWNGQWDEEV